MREKHKIIGERLTNDEKKKIILGYFSEAAILIWMLDNEFMDGTEPRSAIKRKVGEHIDELWEEVACSI
jgi:hypothetical protein